MSDAAVQRYFFKHENNSMLQIGVPVKLIKSFKMTFKGVHFLVKLQPEGCKFTKNESLHRKFLRILLTFLFIFPYEKYTNKLSIL